MDADLYRTYLTTHITPFCRPASGGRVVTCRCFYCPDSNDPRHSHFYISIPDGKSPSLFYCQKCHTKGLVTAQYLLDWGIYDKDIALMLTEYNKHILSIPDNYKYRSTGIYRIMYDYIHDIEKAQVKVDYINHRLGTNLTIGDCIRLKIILNIEDVIRRNNLELSRNYRIVNQLQDTFMGFLSHDNAFINMRYTGAIPENQLHESIRKRYINYNLVGKFENTCRFYNIPVSLDLGDPTPIRLHIAEGPFDILSVCLNLRKSLKRDVYIAVGGSGYFGVLRYFISLLRVPNLEIHVYPDNDMDRFKVLQIYDFVAMFRYKFYIHRNTSPGEKDFGVPMDRINETIEEI